VLIPDLHIIHNKPFQDHAWLYSLWQRPCTGNIVLIHSWLMGTHVCLDCLCLCVSGGLTIQPWCTLSKIGLLPCNVFQCQYLWVHSYVTNKFREGEYNKATLLTAFFYNYFMGMCVVCRGLMRPSQDTRKHSQHYLWFVYYIHLFYVIISTWLCI